VTPLLSIGDFSRMTLLSVKRLRHYHDVGLLSPAAIDAVTGYRRYALEQVPIAQVIRRLRELGMPLEDVRQVVDAPDVQARNSAISAHLRRMEGELAQTQATVRALRRLLAETGPSSIAVTYRTVGPSETIAIRERVGHDEAGDWLEAAFGELRDVVASTELLPAGSEAALYSSELLEEEHGDLVALIPLAERASVAAGRAHRVLLPAVEYAVAVHAGSLDDIDRTYAALGAVVAERAIGVEGLIREDFLVGARDTADEQQHRTEISWPVFHTTPHRQ
jgi:DNA-binding transcriptional MerR regulator